MNDNTPQILPAKPSYDQWLAACATFISVKDELRGASPRFTYMYGKIAEQLELQVGPLIEARLQQQASDLQAVPSDTEASIHAISRFVADKEMGLLSLSEETGVRNGGYGGMLVRTLLMYNAMEQNRHFPRDGARFHLAGLLEENRALRRIFNKDDEQRTP